jgi:hypothetical protein
MAIAEIRLPDQLNSRLLANSFKEGPVKLLALKKRGAEHKGACLIPCLDMKTSNPTIIAVECPNGRVFAAIKKAQ